MEKQKAMDTLRGANALMRLAMTSSDNENKAINAFLDDFNEAVDLACLALEDLDMEDS